MLRVASLLALIIVLSGCSQLNVRLPAQRFESPEAEGGFFKFHLGGGVSSAVDVTLSSDASQRPPSGITQPKLGPGADFPLKIGMGLFSHLEVSVRGGFNSVPAMLTGKLQLIGTPESEAKAGNFSVAVTAAGGYESSSNNGDQLGDGGPGGYNWTARADTTVDDYALIIGIRPTESLLIYASGFYSHYKMTGNIHDDLSSNSLSPAADYTLSGQGQRNGGNLGIQTGKSVLFSVEASASQVQWTNAQTYSELSWGGFLAFSF
jgi:hypothetical protein